MSAPRRLFRLAGWAAVIAPGVLVLIILLTPVVPWWIAWLAGSWSTPRRGTLIVLGGSMLDADTIGYSSYLRGVYAVREWRRGACDRVVVSGGGASPPAPAIARFLASEGVPPAAVELETASTSTRENAIEVARLLQGQTGHRVLLTSDYHMRRAQACFRRVGIDAQPFPVPDAAKRVSASRFERLTVVRELAAETAGIILYRLRGWI